MSSAPHAPDASQLALDQERLRFELELEFVSLFADLTYVEHLSAEGYLQRPSFRRYLQYLLTTWSTPAYAAYVRFPLSLLHLRLAVYDDSFLELVANADAVAELRGAEIAAWRSAAAPTQRRSSEVREAR